MQASLPPNEPQRLRALLDYQILGTAPESKYDDIAALASEICQTPIALISFVAEDRLWFKAKTGLEADEIPRNVSFCAHALGSSDLLVVPDATQDPRFADSPLVTGENAFRFYAGAPLVTPSGETLGMLCVIDHRPRELTGPQLQSLRTLGQNIVEKMELRRQMEREQRMATLLHEAQQLANMGSWEYDIKTSVLTWSDETYLLFGIQPQDFGGTLEAFLDFILPEDRLSLEETQDVRSASLQILEAEYRIRRADGEIRWMLDRGKAVYDEAGEIVCRRGVVMDITERKAAEETLRASEDRFRSFMAYNPAAGWITDDEGRFQYVSPGYYRMFAVGEVDLTHRKITDLYEPALAKTYLDNNLQVGREGRIVEAVEPGIRKNGEPGEFLVVKFPIARPNGETWVGGVAIDMSERKKAEEERDRLFNLSEDLICVATFEGHLEQVNPAWTQTLGWSAEDYSSSDFLTFVHPDDLAITQQMQEELRRGHPIRDFEHRYRTKDGGYRWLSWRCHSLPEKRRIFGIARDVTERKRAEEHLLQSEQRYRALFERSPVGIATGGFDDPFASTINQRYCDIVGYTREEMLALNFTQYSHPDDLEADNASMKQLLAGEVPHFTMQKRLIRKDKSIVWVSLTVVPLWSPGEKPGSCMAVIEDITERKLVEETLRESEERFRKLLQNVPTVAIQGYNPDGKVLYWNRASELFYGYSSQEAVGRNLLDLIIPPELRPTVAEALRGVREENRDIPHGELTLVRKNGTRISVFSSHAIVRRANGEAELFCIDIDLSERKQNEERLIEQATLLDQAHDAILVKDLQDHIIYWNKGAERTYGWTAAEALGRKTAELLSRDPIRLRETFSILLSQSEWQGELIKRRKDGNDISVDARWTLVHDKLGQPKSILAIETDTTERKKLESHFLRAQRMDSIGTLAGGIAHDLNNMLAPILMSLEILRMKFPDEETASLLETLSISAQRGADLVRQVLSFARGVEGQRVVVHLVHLLQDIKNVAKDTFPKSIRFDLEAGDDLWTVDGDPTQLHQVFLNLSVNARDAMPQGGRIVANMENIVLDDTYAAMNPGSEPGSYVLVKISDTGTGMPPAVQEKIFEPFFTTKEFGKGTGLGLSTTQAIVKSHGGFINLYSEMGRGTTFKIYLPAHRDQAQPKVVAPPRAALPHGNNELILVVDDEDAIRQTVQATLAGFGYRTLLARHGAEAISLYARQPEEIAVVLTDMAMPIMDGPATIIALRSMNPAVKIIGSSGLTSNGGVAKAVGANIEFFVSKPYTADALLWKLHDILHPKSD